MSPTQPDLIPAPPQSVLDPGQRILIYFDGGCSPNPGRKYGSFEALLGDKVIIRRERFDLGIGTNNEAEFEALEAALACTLVFFSARVEQISDFDLLIQTDSTIVRNRMMRRNIVYKKRGWADASQRMFNLASRCLDLASKFKSFKVEWSSRVQNVQRFGH